MNKIHSNRYIAFNADNIQIGAEKVKKIRYIKNIKDKKFLYQTCTKSSFMTSHDKILSN